MTIHSEDYHYTTLQLELEKKLAISKEALEFYAITSSWDNRDELIESPCIAKDDMELFEKWDEHIGGKRAREALKQIGEL